MKIWHLISNRWNSAISEYALSAAKATRLQGSEVLVSCLDDSPIAKRFAASEFEIQSTVTFNPGGFSRLASIAKKFAPDVIFTYGGPETTAALFFKGRAKLIRFHGYKTESTGAISTATRKLGHLHVDQVITPSNFIAEGLQDQVTCPIDVITLGCDTGVFQLKEIERAARPELLIFGRLDPVKGHREFLSVFKDLLEYSEAKNLPRPKLKIVGLPANLSMTHILEAARAQSISSDDLEIQCDRISNVAELMSRVSLGVVSSLGSEAICRVAEEFLLCGTPVVTTDVGSLREVFFEKTFGRSYGENTLPLAAEAVAERLWPSFAEDLDARRLRAAAAKEYFSIDSMARELDRIVR